MDRVTATPTLSAGSCGSCTLCCTLLRVALDPPKPPRETCRHCTKAGCAIYETRPAVCRSWRCAWLQSQDSPHPMPRDTRPDKCGVVIEGNSRGGLFAHTDKPGSWKRPAINAAMRALAVFTSMIVESDGDVFLLRPDGSTVPLYRLGVDPISNEVFYSVEPPK